MELGGQPRHLHRQHQGKLALQLRVVSRQLAADSQMCKMGSEQNLPIQKLAAEGNLQWLLPLIPIMVLVHLMMHCTDPPPLQQQQQGGRTQGSYGGLGRNGGKVKTLDR